MKRHGARKGFKGWKGGGGGGGGGGGEQEGKRGEVKRHSARKGLKGWKGDENRRQEAGRRRVCIIGGRECESAEGGG